MWIAYTFILRKTRINSYDHDINIHLEIVQLQPIRLFPHRLWDFQQVAHWHCPPFPNHNPYEINQKTKMREMEEMTWRKETLMLHMETKEKKKVGVEEVGVEEAMEEEVTEEEAEEAVVVAVGLV